jgi:hypothetical protein
MRNIIELIAFTVIWRLIGQSDNADLLTVARKKEKKWNEKD